MSNDTPLHPSIVAMVSLAANIAAVSFVGRDVGNPRRVLAKGIGYSLGRAATYVLVGALAVSSVLSIPSVSFFLQERMNQVLGPLNTDRPHHFKVQGTYDLPWGTGLGLNW